MFTVDASVWVNAHSPAEAGQPESQALLDALLARAIPIYAPTLLSVEVAGVIARTRGDAVLARDMSDALRALPSVIWIALDTVLAERAADLAAQQRLRGADAVYAAVALGYGCELISLDREHLTRLPPIVRTITPADALARLGTAP